MKIYLCCRDFRYEVEGVCKLFFPVERFQFPTERPTFTGQEDITVVRSKRVGERTLLWVFARVGGKTAHAYLFEKEPSVSLEERLLCTLLYRVLQKLTGVTPGWGILTGVRPVHMLQRMRREGSDEAEIRRFFLEDLLVQPQKLELATQTADRETPILQDLSPRTFSLYVAIPFCVSRCSYCSFVSHAIDRPKATDKIGEYLDLLCIELQETARLAKKLGLTLDTVYIGGGTPTALSAHQLKQVTDAIKANFDLPNVREYTIEAGRADTITREKLEVILNSGADRISINPQTFHDSVLQAIGRKHTAKQVLDCYALAREMGYNRINMDFIAGLPTDTPEGFFETIDKAIALRPENITVHTLSIKRAADLFTAEGIAEYAKTAATGRMTDYAHRALTDAGYRPYYLYRQKNSIGNLENVGYALPGHESYYNVYIMEECQTVLACGAGGVTKLVSSRDGSIRRVFNFKYHFEYISRFDEILARKAQITQADV